jgi:hypothetical protein
MSYLPDALRRASGCTVQAAAIWHRHRFGQPTLRSRSPTTIDPCNSSSPEGGNAYECLVHHQGSTAE